MNNESLNVAEAPKKKKLLLKPIFITLACVALAIALGLFLYTRGSVSASAEEIAKAEYPEMAKYPEGEMLPGFDEKYSDWSDSNRKRRAFFGAGEGLEPFFESTVSQFLTSDKEENLVYSPLNVYMALAMLAETTDGESREQILALLGYSDIETLGEKANAIWNANYCDDGALTSILASSLWLNESVSFKNDTINKLASNYYASTYSGRMGSQELNGAMQNWINEQTGGLLKEQVSSLNTDPNTVMALITTIYFRAKWTDEFSKGNNTSEIFHAPSGDVECEFMNCTETYGSYYYGEKFGATVKSLENGGNMYFILPDEGVSINELLSDGEALSFIAMDFSDVKSKTLRINFSMPKFDVDSKMDLANGLKNLGISDCFSAQNADFSPLVNGEEPVWLDKVEHAARVAVDEEGVVATAYTAMLMCGAAMPPDEEIDFVLDRPFIFVIESEDSLPLFVGVVNNP